MGGESSAPEGERVWIAAEPRRRWWERTIGVLAVRGKGFDVTFYFVVGAMMAALAVGVP